MSKQMTESPLSLSQLHKFAEADTIGHHIWVNDFSLSNLIAATLDLSEDHGIYAVISSGEPYYTEKDYGVTWVAYDTHPAKFSRKEFMQQFTDIFSKNNKKDLEICVEELISELNITEPVDKADVIDKAVFAAFYEICSGHVLNTDKTIKSIVKEHLRSVLSK